MFLHSSAFFDTFVLKLKQMLTGQLFIVFLVIALGYLLGRITVKKVSFGSSGVFLVALLAGIVVFLFPDAFDWKSTATISAVKNIGLALFVTGIGFIAGPTFIRNFKKKAGSYITIGITAVLTGTILSIIIIAIDKVNLTTATGTGLLMGALSSTPGLNAATEVFSANAGEVAAASGIGYPFGVLGVVLFVQLLPKLLKKDMAVELEKLRALTAPKNVTQTNAESNQMIAQPPKKRIKFDSLGICVFSLASALGMILGAITFRMSASAMFSLGTTGGCLILGLLFGHFGHIGSVSLEVPKTTLNVLREMGLVFFLAASGIEGGLKFLDIFSPIMLLYGAIMTISPMVVAFVVARFVFKLELLNNLGSICGGMTSTPALGALIHASGTDDVAQSYAATYPISLFLLVFVPQVISWIF